ncbi:MAG: RNA pseudouridine synthase [Dictyoglomus sp. NZ13-RE01]|nr:MAG: RNA pseudouridine synthase [Dictyoglomus sp. NZ13-RE01]
MDFNLKVIYEDNHLLVVEKPAGILVQGDSTRKITLLEIAKSYIKEKYKKPGNVFLGIVHRLDKNVSGVLVFARNSKSAGRLSQAFREHMVEKVYIALTEGNTTLKEGIWENYIFWDERNKKAVVFENEVTYSKKAITYFKVIEKRKELILWKLSPKTGRKHQLRAELSHIGCPIVGDVKYGSKVRFVENAIALHCYKIKFKHPVRDEIMEFKMDPPVAFYEKFGLFTLEI